MWTILLTGAELLFKGLGPAGLSLASRTPAVAAYRVAWPLMRTFGFFNKEILKAFGATTPQQIALGESLTFPPFMGSFLRGVAYDNATEVAEGWLAWWAEAFIPGTAGHRSSFKLAEALEKREFFTALDIIADVFAELKLEEAAKFLNGMLTVLRDVGVVLGQDTLFAAASAWLATLLRDLSSGELIDTEDWLKKFKRWLKELEQEAKKEEGRQRDKAREEKHQETLAKLKAEREAEEDPSIEKELTDVPLTKAPPQKGRPITLSPVVTAALEKVALEAISPLGGIIGAASPTLGRVVSEGIKAVEKHGLARTISDIARIIQELKKGA